MASENEWYKAAYHKNDGITGNYFSYPTSTDIAPGNLAVNPDPGNCANYYKNDSYTIGPLYYRTVIGEFENSASPYGTFDEGGNVWEWNEAVVSGSARGIRGGGFDGMGGLFYSQRGAKASNNELNNLGFRIVASFCLVDYDYDFDVDKEDLEVFEACVSGPSIPQLDTACRQKADLDHDGEVDQSDFGVFQQCYTGASKIADPNCTN